MVALFTPAPEEAIQTPSNGGAGKLPHPHSRCCSAVRRKELLVHPTSQRITNTWREDSQIQTATYWMILKTRNVCELSNAEQGLCHCWRLSCVRHTQCFSPVWICPCGLQLEPRTKAGPHFCVREGSPQDEFPNSEWGLTSGGWLSHSQHSHRVSLQCNSLEQGELWPLAEGYATVKALMESLPVWALQCWTRTASG